MLVSKRRKKKRYLIRLLSYLRGYLPIYLISFIILSSISFSIDLIGALAIKGLSEACIQRDFDFLVSQLIIVGGGLVVILTISPIMGYLFSLSAKKAEKNLRNELFDHIQNLHLEYLQKNHSGDLISRLNNDILVARNAFNTEFLAWGKIVISGIGAFSAMFYLSWEIASIAIAFGGINTLINMFFSKKIKKVSKEVQVKLSGFNQRLSDVLNGMRVVKSFNLYNLMDQKCGDANESIRKSAMNRVKMYACVASINSFMGLMIFIGIIFIGSFFVINNYITFGDLMAEILLMNSLVMVFNNIGEALSQMQTSMAGASRIFEIMDQEVEDTSVRNVLELEESDQIAVDLDDVSFSYSNDERVIDGINLRIHRNTTVAFVGESGSGKSTLMKLISGFYEKDSGNIRIWDRRIEDYGIYQLRSLISYVSQNSYLFSGTIEENLRYGKEDVSNDKIIEACKNANIHEFIVSLPDGYETEVGEGGGKLSGGQKQRISIARALLKDAPLLLLDEATSALDSKSETLIKEALERLMKGRTTIAIAHRLSTIRSADKIYVMDKGKIVEDGNHEQLILNGGRYKRLYDLSK